MISIEASKTIQKPLEDIVEGERFNAYDVEKVKTQPLIILSSF
jgi:hypothetical protein